MAQTKRRVLVVDDDLDILESLQLLLEDTYDVTVAENGRDALALLRSRPFDAIVLDLMMPVMSGSALVHALDRAGIDVPIVLASAIADLPKQAAALRVADAITKPFDVEQLEEKLARVIGGPTGGPGNTGPGSSGPRSPRGGGSGSSAQGGLLARLASVFAPA